MQTHLNWGQGDPLGGAAKLAGNVTAAPAYAAAHVHHLQAHWLDFEPEVGWQALSRQVVAMGTCNHGTGLHMMLPGWHNCKSGRCHTHTGGRRGSSPPQGLLNHINLSLGIGLRRSTLRVVAMVHVLACTVKDHGKNLGGWWRGLLLQIKFVDD